MKPKAIPVRSCVVTREKLPKQSLIRVVRTPEGNVVVDVIGKMNGRGAYIKKDLAILPKAKTVLARHLGVDIPEQIILELTNIINTED